MRCFVLLRSTLFLAGTGVFAGVGVLATAARPAAAQTPAQTAVTREALVGTWVRIERANEGRVALYYVFTADGTYDEYKEADGRREQYNSGKALVWALKGDTLKLDRAPYWKRRVVLQGQELALVDLPYAYPDSATGQERYQECRVVYVRFDSLKPLPEATPARSCQAVAVLPPRPQMPKATELLGTWAALDSSTWQGIPYCSDRSLCTVVTYDTLIIRADSTMSRRRVEVASAFPQGQVDRTAVPELQWWIASDTMYTAPRLTTGTQPVKAVWKTARLWWEDDGKFLILNNGVYHRAATKP